MNNVCSCDKISYNTKPEAQAAIKGIKDDNKIKMNFYKCPEGNGFHLTTAKTGKSLKDIPHGLQSIIPLLTKKIRRKNKIT